MTHAVHLRWELGLARELLLGHRRARAGRTRRPQGEQRPGRRPCERRQGGGARGGCGGRRRGGVGALADSREDSQARRARGAGLRLRLGSGSGSGALDGGGGAEAAARRAAEEERRQETIRDELIVMAHLTAREGVRKDDCEALARGLLNHRDDRMATRVLVILRVLATATPAREGLWARLKKACGGGRHGAGAAAAYNTLLEMALSLGPPATAASTGAGAAEGAALPSLALVLDEEPLHTVNDQQRIRVLQALQLLDVALVVTLLQHSAPPSAAVAARAAGARSVVGGAGREAAWGRRFSAAATRRRMAPRPRSVAGVRRALSPSWGPRLVCCAQEYCPRTVLAARGALVAGDMARTVCTRKGVRVDRF